MPEDVKLNDGAIQNHSKLAGKVTDLLKLEQLLKDLWQK